jgi:hypothetical protein
LYSRSRNNQFGSPTNRWDFYIAWSQDSGITWAQPVNCTQSLSYNPGLPQLAKRIDTQRMRAYYVYLTHIPDNYDPYWTILNGNPPPCRIYLGCSPFTGIEESGRFKVEGERLKIDILPNIIRNNAQLQCAIPDMQKIRLNLHDIAGRKVLTITEGILEPGVYTYNFTASNLSSGIYFLVLEGEKETKTQKILIVR